MKIKTGILFGGSSRHREKSFLGAEFINLHLPGYSMEKILIWIDKEGKLFHVKESCFVSGNVTDHLIKEIDPSTLGQYINIAIVTLSADDKKVSSLYEILGQLNIPNNLYHPSITFAQDVENWWHALKAVNFRSPSSKKLSLTEWDNSSPEIISSSLKNDLGELIQIIPLPYSSKNGGSFIVPGTKNDIVQERINRAFFRDWISKTDWKNRTEYEKDAWIAWLSDPLEGPDFPLYLVTQGTQKIIIARAEEFVPQIDKLFADDSADEFVIGIEPAVEEAYIQLASIPNGTPFQSIIWQNDNHWHCLPPLTNNDIFLGRKNESVALTELQVTEISIQMIQLGQNFQFNSPQLVSGFVTSSGKSYPIEIQSFIEVIDEKKWFEHLGTVDQTPTSFLEIIVNQILRCQELSGGISGKIASQLHQILTEKIQTDYPVSLQAILLDSMESLNKNHLAEAIGWYEKLAMVGTIENALVFSENSSLGVILYRVPARWIYLTIQNNLEIQEVFNKIRKHCSKISIAELREKEYRIIPISAGKIATTGALFQWLEREQLPYWGVASAFSKVNFKRSTQIQSLNKNGIKTIPFWQISTWLNEKSPSDKGYIITTDEYHFNQKTIKISGEHEINAFRDFVKNTPRIAETQRNRKIWQLFFEEIQESNPSNAYILQALEENEIIISFFHLKNSQDSFDRFYLTPIHAVKGNDDQINYLYQAHESKLLLEISSVWTEFIEQIEKGLQTLGFNSPGYVTLYATIFEDKSFELIFKEVNPLFSARDKWIEKIMLHNQITWYQFIYNQNEYAKFKMPITIELEEKEESIILFEEKKLPFQHVNSDIVVINEEAVEDVEAEEVEVQEDAKKERENRINEAMNNLAPTRFSRNFKDYASEAFRFLTSWFFIKNLLAFIVSIFIIINLVKGVLFLYTRHGSAKEVIDYSGMPFDDALEKAEDQGFKLVASDEVYVLNRPAGIIISQVPQKGAKIKSGRTIFCVITGGAAPSVTLPKLSNNDEYEAYQKQLLRLGIYSRIREERFESEYEEKTILEVYFEGKRLSNSRINASVVKLPKGSYLDFVISVRNTDRAPVPNLICNTYEEAATNIIANDLTIGTIMGPENNVSFSGMYVYKQEPMPGEGVFLPKGSPVILYLQPERPAECPEY
ncbi:MAG: PASTA domain-containing protein [Saprospiraceae bacterium]|nr:PASTA domain-containing protein [Saprospiraceae bacterium]